MSRGAVVAVVVVVWLAVAGLTLLGDDDTTSQLVAIVALTLLGVLALVVDALVRDYWRHHRPS